MLESPDSLYVGCVFFPTYLLASAYTLLETPQGRLDVRRNSFSHMIVTTWNSLPPSVVEFDSLNTFKNRIDEHLERIGLL